MPRIAVSGPSRLVADAAAQISSAGGSVVDAAIVAGLTAMCTEPGVCGPGGGGFITVDLPGHDPVVIDGYMAYPGLGFEGEPRTRQVTMEYGGGVTTLVGAGSVAVPGAFAAMEKASEMFGVAPWRELMEAVASTVERGFPLSPSCRLYLTDSGPAIFSDDPAVRQIFYDGDRLRDSGETVVFPGLSETLRWIGEEGAGVFYRGDLGRQIVADLAGRGGCVTMEDLASYRAIPREPLSVELAGWNIEINPPPAVGGVTMALALADIAAAGENTPRVWAEALVDAFRVRTEDLDPDNLEGSAHRVLTRRGLLSPSTVTVAAADDEDGAVAATFSAGYGSGVIPAGTGMMMNNSLGELELVEGVTPRPGERMLSNMAPSVARRGTDVVAVGSPGADRITSALVVTLACLVAGEGPEAAIDHPRVHPEFGEEGVRIAAEPGLDLEALPYPIRWFDGLHMYFGGTNGAGLLEGELHARADPRRHGVARILG
ncbi:MAG: gamma-glutamyltransferase [Acidimicrobiia bacterium]